ncbi:MAG: amidophosphoribosyltransferase [Ruminococcus sp.]|nr:amidophosphoribosyltransferase [Ruminococcus sp.]
MGGFFGAASKNDCVTDVFFGTDYHSHLGTRRGGMTSYAEDLGFQRNIHSIENSPFRTKFENDVIKMKGKICIGCISDTDPQPILVRSKLGLYAVCTVGIIRNADALVNELLENGCANFETMSSGNINSGDLIGALIAQKDNFVDGIRYAQDKIEGTMSLIILTKNSIIAARDKFGRLPIIIGRRSDGFCLSTESFAFQKLGYDTYKELQAGEIAELTADECRTLSEGDPSKMKICTFLWTYYGYPNAVYEGINVEVMRTRNGEIMAENDIKNGRLPDVDYICGVPDSGTPHAIGYANKSGIPFARPFIKYTPTWPRSFMPTNQSMRNQVAKMKLIPVHELIVGKKLLFVDDSIVRGTQMRETVEFLYENGAKEVHMRSACPPIMYGCKYLNFSRSTSEMELIARQIIDEFEGAEGIKYISEYSDSNTERGRRLRDEICRRLKLTSLEFQSLPGTVAAVAPMEECKLCTYCWNGQE